MDFSKHLIGLFLSIFLFQEQELIILLSSFCLIVPGSSEGEKIWIYLCTIQYYSYLLVSIYLQLLRHFYDAENKGVLLNS